MLNMQDTKPWEPYTLGSKQELIVIICELIFHLQCYCISFTHLMGLSHEPDASLLSVHHHSICKNTSCFCCIHSCKLVHFKSPGNLCLPDTRAEPQPLAKSKKQLISMSQKHISIQRDKTRKIFAVLHPSAPNNQDSHTNRTDQRYLSSFLLPHFPIKPQTAFCVCAFGVFLFIYCLFLNQLGLQSH